MLTVHIRPHWEISVKGETPLDTKDLLGLLMSIQDTGSIAQAAKSVGLSYRYAWGLLRSAEALFGEQLLQTGRGRGTSLTPLAQKLVWADRRIAARLSPTLHSLASELEAELGRMAANKIRTLRMDASHGFAVAALIAGIDRDALPLELRFRTSTDAVAALARRECDLAGFHIPLGRFEAATVAWYLRWLDPNLHCLVRVAGRQQGLIVARGNPLGINGLADLARPEVRFVNRQAGSGTRMLLEMMLAADGPPLRIDQRLQQRRVHPFGRGRLHRQRHGRRRHRHARRRRPVQARFPAAGARTLLFCAAHRCGRGAGHAPAARADARPGLPPAGGRPARLRCHRHRRTGVDRRRVFATDLRSAGRRRYPAELVITLLRFLK